MVYHVLHTCEPPFWMYERSCKISFKMLETGLLENESDNGSDAFDFSDNDKDNGSQASDAIDSQEGDFTDDKDAEISVNASQASGIESVEKETPDKDHDDSVKENGVNASQDSVENPDKDDNAGNGSQAGIDSVEQDQSTDVMDVDDGYESENSDIIFVGISVPDKPHPSIVGRVHRSRFYKCYLCGFIAEMQVTFVDHFTKRIQVLSTSVIIVVLCLKVAMACSSMDGHINTFVISVIYVVKGLSFRIK